MYCWSMTTTDPGSTAAALEAYGLDPGPFEDDPPTYRPGEDTGWQELEDRLYERALAFYERIGDVPDRADFARRQRHDSGLDAADWIQATDPDPQARALYERLDEQGQDRLTEAVMEDIHLELYSQAVEREEGFHTAVNETELLLGRERFEEYAVVEDSEHSYTVSVLAEPDEIRRVHDTVGSCLEEDTDRPVEYADDPYTIVAGIERDGDIQGYLRALLLEDADDRPFLGLDTIEVPHRDHFQHEDVVRAGGLALAHLASETGVDRVVGTDERVGFGLRQAFSNTSEEVVFDKPGESVFTYSFCSDGGGVTGYRLWENIEGIIADYEGGDGV